MAIAAGRVVQVGLLADEALNVATGGAADKTLSERAAAAAALHQRWACVLCRFLHHIVQRRHCRKQLAGKPMHPRNYARAAALLIIVYGGVAWIIDRIFVAL